jgi:hypothetical protein
VVYWKELYAALILRQLDCSPCCNFILLYTESVYHQYVIRLVTTFGTQKSEVQILSSRLTPAKQKIRLTCRGFFPSRTLRTVLLFCNFVLSVFNTMPSVICSLRDNTGRAIMN